MSHFANRFSVLCRTDPEVLEWLKSEGFPDTIHGADLIVALALARFLHTSLVYVVEEIDGCLHATHVLIWMGPGTYMDGAGLHTREEYEDSRLVYETDDEDVVVDTMTASAAEALFFKLAKKAFYDNDSKRPTEPGG